MGLKVGDKIISQTSHCQKCFDCLENNGKTLCKIRECIEGKVHFIECADDQVCSYKKDYGGQKYCDCPVRKEIFNKYKL